MSEKANCPHCGEEYTKRGMNRHISACKKKLAFPEFHKGGIVKKENKIIVVGTPGPGEDILKREFISEELSALSHEPSIAIEFKREFMEEPVSDKMKTPSQKEPSRMATIDDQGPKKLSWWYLFSGKFKFRRKKQ
jgi:hypothetical protein